MMTDYRARLFIGDREIRCLGVDFVSAPPVHPGEAFDIVRASIEMTAEPKSLRRFIKAIDRALGLPYANWKPSQRRPIQQHGGRRLRALENAGKVWRFGWTGLLPPPGNPSA